MSLNQIGFFVLPKKCWVEMVNENNFKLDDEGFFDDELIWNKFNIHYSLFSPINEILPITKSWSNNIMMFGEENSNRFEVLFNKSKIVVSVSFRIDFLSNYEIILIKLLNFFKSNDLIVIDEKLNFVELKYQIFEEILSSR